MLYKLLLSFCLYLPFQFALNYSEDFDLVSGRVFAIALGVLWIFKGLAQRKLFIPNKIQVLFLISFIFLSAFSFVFAQNIDWAGRKLLFLLSFVSLFFIAADAAREKAKKIIEFLVYGAGLASLIGIFQFVLQFFIGIDEALKLWQQLIAPFLGKSFSQAVFQNSSWLVEVSGNTHMRAVAFFPDPHMFSFYLGMLLPFSIAVCLKYKSEKKSRFYLFLFISICIFVSDILTFSRGGYLGLLAGLIFTIFIFRKGLMDKLSIKKLAVAAIFIVLTIAIIIIPSPISQRLFSSFDLNEGSNLGRLETWRQSLNVIENNPFGIGLGNYALEIKPSAGYREPIYSHNLYFDIAAETGIVNTVIFIGLLIVSILSFIKLGRNNKFYLAGAISLFIFSVHSIFETPLYSVHILPLLLILIALSAATYVIPAKAEIR